MIAEIPSDPEEIPDEEDREIELAIDEAKKQYNLRDESKKMFRIAEEVFNNYCNEVAFFNATINLKTNPARMRPDKQGILIACIIKDDRIRTETRLLGDVNIDAIKNLQLKMPGLSSRKMYEEKKKPERTESNVPIAETKIRETSVLMAVNASCSTNRPEVMVDPSPEGTIEDMVREMEVGPEEIPQTSTPKPVQKRKSRKRVHTYREEETSTSESPEESSEEETKKKRSKKVTTSQKKPTDKKQKAPKTVAKDGRKLVDLSNRIRDAKGRILGYKPGTSSGAKKPKCKENSPTTTSAQPTPEDTLHHRMYQKRDPRDH